MPNNRNLGGVFMTDVDGQMGTGTVATSEFVCGIIFDTSIFGENQALTGDAAKNFANGNVAELNSADDLKTVGLDNSQMCGLPYYHINTFFTLAGRNQRLFVSFMNSSKDPEFTAISKMQAASGGIIYQIGVWTGVPFATASTGGDYKVEGASLLSKLQSQAEALGGKIGVTNYDGNSPLNIILNAPPIDAVTCDLDKLPDLVSLDMSKVSIMLGQCSSDEVHKIQVALIKAGGDSALHYVQVGNVGAALACLAVAPVEVNIGHLSRFNLSSVFSECEFGFGNLTLNSGKTAFDESKAAFNNVKTVLYIPRKKIAQKGYNFLTNIDGMEGGVFFSDDQTLSTGDYRSLTRCRTIHKSRRVVRLALLPLVKQDFFVNTDTGYLTDADLTEIQNTIYDAIDNNMVDPGTSTSQISGREVIINDEQNILDDDQFLVGYNIVPKGYTNAIFCSEGFVKSITAS